MKSACSFFVVPKLSQQEVDSEKRLEIVFFAWYYTQAHFVNRRGNRQQKG